MIFAISDLRRAIIAGFLIALFSLPVFANLDFLKFFKAKPGWIAGFVSFWIFFVPSAAGIGLYIAYRIAMRTHAVLYEIAKYGIIGWLNVFLNAGIFNLFILITGIAKGWSINLFVVIAFIVTITNSFFWNKFWTFGKRDIHGARSEYVKFFVVNSVVALLNTGLMHVLINIMGAPAEISERAWANIALLITIPVAFFGNFFGIKFFAFRK